MPQYRFVVNGDFVEFHDGAMHVMTFRNTFQDIDWYYETAPGIRFILDGVSYKVENANEIEIDGVTLSANSDFDAAIIGVFPNLAGGGGPGGGNGIYGGSGSLTGNTVVALNGNSIEFKEGVITRFIITAVNTSMKSPDGNTSIRIDDGTIQMEGLPAAANMENMKVMVWDTLSGEARQKSLGIDDVLAEGQALTTDRTIDLSGFPIHFIDVTSQRARVSIEPQNGIIELAGSTLVGGGNQAALSLASSTVGDLVDFYIVGSFDDGDKVARIYGAANATTATITHTADTHTFNGKDILGAASESGAESATISWQATQSTGDGNSSALAVTANPSYGEYSLSAFFNDGDARVSIDGDADVNLANLSHLARHSGNESKIELSATSIGTSITHTADTHVFVGAVMLPTSDPGVPGAIWNNAGTPAISA